MSLRSGSGPGPGLVRSGGPVPVGPVPVGPIPVGPVPVGPVFNCFLACCHFEASEFRSKIIAATI